jgi:hypothetical protein
MEKKSEVSFPDLPGYARTLKERLAAGEVFRHFDGGFEVAQMRKLSGLIVMSASQARIHSISKAATLAASKRIGRASARFVMKQGESCERKEGAELRKREEGEA